MRLGCRFEVCRRGVEGWMFKPKVLVVDGNKGYREHLMYALKENYQLFEAENGQTALQYLEEEKRPDVILTDLYLPPRPAYIDEGTALLEKFKEAAPEVKIIIVTTDERKEIIARCRELGADDYIVKPFEVDDLKNAIDRLIPRSAPPEIEPTPEGMERRGYWRESDGRQMGVERRTYWRVKCEIPISYSLHEGEPPITGKSKTINISVTGLMFPIDQHVTQHSVLDIELSFPPQSEAFPVKAIGEVRWAKRVEGDHVYHIGIRFFQIWDEDKERIANYIYGI